MDLLLKNCQLIDRGYVDIAIENDRFVKIDKKIDQKAKEVIDVKGKLVLPPLIDPHIHLDKCLTSEIMRQNKSGTLDEAIEILWDIKRKYTEEDVIERALKVIKWAISNGTLYMRTHCDVDTIAGLTPLKALIKLREMVSPYLYLQIVAFPQEGILKDEGTEDLLWQALEMGADVVGGMPFNEYTEEDQKKHIDIVFDIAKEFRASIDMHVDETDDPNAKTLHYLAVKTIRESYYGKVTAGHTCALASYDDVYANFVISLVKNAKMNIITNPATNLMLQGRFDKEPKRRGITRVREFLNKGVNVSFGQDCIKDAFYPYYGQADMLEVALITAHAVQMTTEDDVKTLINMMTYNAAKVLELREYGIKENNLANFVIFDCYDYRDLIRTRPSRKVFVKGKMIAEKVVSTHLNFELEKNQESLLI